MQTFLPYASFFDSARVLDYRRLGKQRVEVLQILRALTDPTYGWQNHPAVKMWRGSESWLIRYGQYICTTWQQHCYQDTCMEKICFYRSRFPPFSTPKPFWLGDDKFHRSHQSNLLRKDPVHYAQHFYVPNDLPYVWPV